MFIHNVELKKPNEIGSFISSGQRVIDLSLFVSYY